MIRITKDRLNIGQKNPEIQQNTEDEKDEVLINQNKIVFKTIESYVNHTILFNILSSHHNFLALFADLQKPLTTEGTWAKEMKKIQDKSIHMHYHLYAQVAKEEKELSIELKEKIEQELMKLPAILIEEPEPENESLIHMDTLIKKIRDDVKNGNRVTFKLLQELQQQVETIEGSKDSELQEQRTDLKVESQKHIQRLTNLLLEVFDLLDIVRESAAESGDNAWVRETVQVVDKGLALLADYGIEEIEVIGQPFDGSTMVGIGTVGQEASNGELEKYEVSSVFQRGFRFKHNGELVRRAKVITVY